MLKEKGYIMKVTIDIDRIVKQKSINQGTNGNMESLGIYFKMFDVSTFRFTQLLNSSYLLSTKKCNFEKIKYLNIT